MLGEILRMKKARQKIRNPITFNKEYNNKKNEFDFFLSNHTITKSITLKQNKNKILISTYMTFTASKTNSKCLLAQFTTSRRYISTHRWFPVRTVIVR